MSAAPLVTVVMNCFNGEQFLRQAVESVLAQTFDDWEIVFWDNQSKDDSAAIFQSYDDPRLRYFHAPEHTLLYEARGHALAHARGKLLAFLDVDDWWTAEKLERQVPLFDDPEVGIACGNYWIVRNERRWIATTSAWPAGRVLDDLLREYFVGLPTLMIRRAALDSLGRGFDSRFHVIGDLDMVIRLAVDWKLACVQQPIAYYRLHGNNETGKQRLRHIQELETWHAEMSRIPAVRESPNFAHLAHRTAYITAMKAVIEGDRLGAYRLSAGLPWIPYRAKLSVACLLPRALFRRIKK